MCGIAGILSKNNTNIVNQLVKMIKNLEYRGYDSCGFALLINNKLLIRKQTGTIDEFIKNNKDFLDTFSTIGIAHTRWATHGNVNDTNAHPHTDCFNTIAVVHNGIIRNYFEIRERLIIKGHKFASDTDTEVVPHLIEEYLKNANDFLKALKLAVQELDGTYALVILTSKEPNKIFFARNGQPLILGLADDKLYIASDVPAFLEWTNKIIVLRDGDIGYISRDQIHIENTFGLSGRPKPETVPWSPKQALKGDYPHFMIKEIFEQPDAIRRTIFTLEKQVGNIVEILLKADNIVFVGAGSSYYSSLYGQYLFNKYRIKALSVIASEFEYYIGPTLDQDDVLIAISQSGETFDTIRAIKIAKNLGVKVIGLVNNMASTIRRLSDESLVMGAGPEIGVVATKTFTTQITSIVLLLGAYLKKTDIDYSQTLSSLEKLPSELERFIPSASNQIKEIAKQLVNINNAFYLGRGLGVPIASEGALKLKETAYVHAEAYPAGESKHGPIALIEPNFLVFNIVVEDNTLDDLISNMEEMKSRGAYTVAISPIETNKLNNVSKLVIRVPRAHPELSGITHVIPLQLLAYHLAVSRGYNPDKPRNLAKSVTVA